MLPLQTFVKQFKDIEFANDILKEKYGVVVKKEPFFLSSGAAADGKFYLYKHCENLTNGFKYVILDDKGDIACVSIKKLPLLNKENAKAIDWTTAYAEDCIEGVPIMVYDYKNKPFVATSASPKGKNMVEDKHITYYAAICQYMARKHKTLGFNNALYAFKPYFYYYLVYDCYTSKIDGFHESLVLISAIDTTTLEPVSDTKAANLAHSLNLSTPDYTMVISYTDSLNYFNTISHYVDKVFVTDGDKKFKLEA